MKKNSEMDDDLRLIRWTIENFRAGYNLLNTRR